MPKFETLFSKYDRLVLFDTETQKRLHLCRRPALQPGRDH